MSAKGSSIQNVGIAEVAEILAAGLMRLRARKSSHILRPAEKVRSTLPPTRAVMRTPESAGVSHMTDPLLPALAALKDRHHIPT